MEDVAYDEQKIALVFDITERSLEQRKHLDAIIERLNVLESMERERPRIEERLKSIVEHSTRLIPAALIDEEQAAAQARR